MILFLSGMVFGIFISLVLVILTIYLHARFSPVYDEVTAENYNDGWYLDSKK